MSDAGAVEEAVGIRRRRRLVRDSSWNVLSRELEKEEGESAADD